jgi:hypothetical protein
VNTHSYGIVCGCLAVRQSAAVRHRASVVRGAVCDSSVWQCVVVHVTVSGSVLAGSVWQCCSACGEVRQCAAVRAAVCGGARCSIVCGSVWQCVAVHATACGSAEGRVHAVLAAVCFGVLDSVWQCAGQCAAVRQCGSVRQNSSVLQCSSVRQCQRQCVAVFPGNCLTN